jgi:EmrB/QacA subfamily drug resistance transporter
MLITRKPSSVLAVLCLVSFMTLIDAYAVNLAAPALQRDLGAGIDQILWIVNGYFLALVVVPITAGRLGDRYGHRTVLIVGLAVFTAASAGCALAGNPTELIVVRVVQGVGAGLLTPQTLALITHVFTPDRRGWAMGVSGAVAGVAVAAGPSLGGILVGAFGWRAIFLVNVPIGIAAALLLTVTAPNPRGPRLRLDLLGASVLAVGLLLITYALIEAEPHHWGAVLAGISAGRLLLIGLGVLGGFVVVQYLRRDRDALIPLQLLRNRDFALMCVAGGALPCSVASMMFLLSDYLQNGARFGAGRAGLILAVAPAVSIYFARCAGRLSDRIGARPVTLAGLSFMAAGVAWPAVLVGPGTSIWTLLPGLVLFGVGMGVVFGGPFILAMRDVDPGMSGTASGVFGTAYRVGGVLGNATVGLVLEAGLAHGHLAGAVRSALLLPLALLIVAGGLTVATRSRPARVYDKPVTEIYPTNSAAGSSESRKCETKRTRT